MQKSAKIRIDKQTKTEILDLGWAMAAAAYLRGKRIFAADTDSMQMEITNHVHAARKHLGLESVRESMKIFSDMLRDDKGFDKDELGELYDWVTKVQWKGKIYRYRRYLRQGLAFSATRKSTRLQSSTSSTRPNSRRARSTSPCAIAWPR